MRPSFPQRPSLPSRAVNDPSYGRGTHTIDDACFSDTDELLARLRERFGSPEYRPPLLPAVALQIHDLTRRSDTSIAQVLALVRRDPLIAAQVLRRAQSPMFASKAPPRSLEDAAARLGMNGMRDLVFEAALSGTVFRAKGFEDAMDAIRKHSLLVAYCTQAVSSLVSVGEDGAYLAGLLHDVGLMAGLHAVAELCRKSKPELEIIATVLRDVHVEAGEIVARLWNLPPALQAVISAHHVPRVGNAIVPLAACVVVGESIAVTLGGSARVGVVELEAPSAAGLAMAKEGLGLDDAAIAQITEHLRKMFAPR